LRNSFGQKVPAGGGLRPAEKPCLRRALREAASRHAPEAIRPHRRRQAVELACRRRPGPIGQSPRDGKPSGPSPDLKITRHHAEYVPKSHRYRLELGASMQASASISRRLGVPLRMRRFQSVIRRHRISSFPRDAPHRPASTWQLELGVGHQRRSRSISPFCPVRPTHQLACAFVQADEALREPRGARRAGGSGVTPTLGSKLVDRHADVVEDAVQCVPLAMSRPPCTGP
jgi:hypothetical protein